MMENESGGEALMSLQSPSSQLDGKSREGGLRPWQ